MTDSLVEHKKFLTLVSNYFLHLKYYNEQGLVRDSSNDYKKFTDHFMIEKSIDIPKLITYKNLELMKQLDIEGLNLNIEPTVLDFVKKSFNYLISSLSSQLFTNERVLITEPKPPEVSWETISSGLNYERNNDSNYSETPSAYILTMY